MRPLSDKEIECINQLTFALQQTCSDFTDTFRILGQMRVKSRTIEQDDSDPEDPILKQHKLILDQLVAISAPIAFHDKKLEDGVYSLVEVERIELALKENPNLLKMHGIDPHAAKAQLDLSKEVHEKIKQH